ncbi:MAG: exonuclease domain-containing protein [Pelosinus sp.]|nr:exonuclease domain-containing protein [Pelosinus sp.]
MERTYIMLDLEWNRPSKSPCYRCPNEIIEIGAVKFDEDLNILDAFSVLIKPKIYPELHSEVQALTKIRKEDLKQGVLFSKAITMFRAWLKGTEFVICTWGKSDIEVLKQNCRFYYNKYNFKWLSRYVDLQEYLVMDRRHHHVGLKEAALLMNIDVQEEYLHTAMGDARLLGQIMRENFEEKRISSYTLNVSTSAIKLKKYCEGDILKINDVRLNHRRFAFNCPHCGRYVKRLHKWIDSGKRFWNICICSCCGTKLSCYVKATIDQVSERIAYTKEFECLNESEYVINKKILINAYRDSRKITRSIKKDETIGLSLPLRDILASSLNKLIHIN